MKRDHPVRQTAAYLVFGVFTALINNGIFVAGVQLLGAEYALIINVFAFVFATAFAFYTNKRYVFCSTVWNEKIVLREAIAFFSGRVASFLLEQAGLLLCTAVFKLHLTVIWGVSGMIPAKIVLSLAATLLNYFLSRYVFRKK